MRRCGRIFFALAIGLAGVVAGLAQVRLVGSDLLGPEFTRALETYAREHDLALTLELRGTRTGIDQLNSARADLGLFLLPPGETPPPDAFVSRAIAFQPVAVLVPRASPLTQLTLAQVRGVFAASGVDSKATWGDLGLVGEWRARPLAVHAPAPQAALTVPLARRLLFSDAELKPTVLVADDLAQLEQRLLTGPNTIGLGPLAPADGSPLRAVALADSASEAAFTPTPENLAAGHYPWRLTLYLTLRRSSAERLLPLLRHILSDVGSDALRSAHLQPLPIGERNQLIFELEELR
jgi:phosphate transport system substrate-binding protein